MKNISAIIIACTLFAVLFVGEISISLYFWSEENYQIWGYIGWVLYPIFLMFCGYVAVRQSKVKKWWFALVFAVVAYLLVLLLAVVIGSGINIANRGLVAVQTPLLMLLFSSIGGGIYCYLSAKH